MTARIAARVTSEKRRKAVVVTGPRLPCRSAPCQAARRDEKQHCDHRTAHVADTAAIASGQNVRRSARVFRASAPDCWHRVCCNRYHMRLRGNHYMTRKFTKEILAHAAVVLCSTLLLAVLIAR